MTDSFPYQPDEAIARRKGENPKPALTVDKPIAMKFRVTMKPNTRSKHYRRGKAKRKAPAYDERERTFY